MVRLLKRTVCLLLLMSVSLFAAPKPMTLSAEPLPQGGWSISWDASVTPLVTYDLWRKNAPCTNASGIFVKVNSAPIAALTFADTLAPTGKVCYFVRAVDLDGLESFDSIRLSLPRPEPPTNLRKAP
jgi:hypothetical protein